MQAFFSFHLFSDKVPLSNAEVYFLLEIQLTFIDIHCKIDIHWHSVFLLTSSFFQGVCGAANLSSCKSETIEEANGKITLSSTSGQQCHEWNFVYNRKRTGLVVSLRIAKLQRKSSRQNSFQNITLPDGMFASELTHPFCFFSKFTNLKRNLKWWLFFACNLSFFGVTK